MSKTTTTNAPTEVQELQKRSQFAEIWRRMVRNKLGMVGLCIVIGLCIIALFANVLSPYDYTEQNFGERFSYPGENGHILGTDNYGRDLLSRLLWGGRTSLLVSLMACGIGLVVGGFLGAISGYYRGAADTIIMRLCDCIMCIPGTLLAVCVSATLGTGTWQTAIACCVGGIPGNCRQLRAQILQVVANEYVEASRACGAKDLRTIFVHVVPNCLAPMIVSTTMGLGGNIMMISGLSFIGLGVQPPAAEWGAMLNAGRTYIRDFYPLVTFPGVCIMVAMFGFNVFGDGLRDALDPKLKR